MILDIKFIILGLLIISSLIPLYIYRKEIYQRLYKQGDIKKFVRDLDSYLSAHYPKINFNFK